ncbi:uncharacterized protein LY89DRAFT_69867 [Mollisia scopiformis]|uniref:Uncharacterized protein n=1 Tax=Mollisia scopiformis TaxID=149040 RepID=A0A194XB76_MOLSC|nr:uncharacterized protein LY89DRAFT_69867 [Mollisia scopiformis]KUJ17012.1 hypothetical protein LY89DRAFT_69867 [Mollisia scopiformis]
MLNLGQSLPGSAVKDLLIVGLDCENNSLGQLPTQFQIALSILDTRHLQRNTSDGDLLRTYQFIVGSPKYFKEASKAICFGQSKHVSFQDLNKEIGDAVAGRDILLVVYGAGYTIPFLEIAGIRLRPLFILDVLKVAQHLLDLSYRIKLEEMLKLLGCMQSTWFLRRR